MRGQDDKKEKEMAQEKLIYPELSITKIKNPSKAWAFPIFGGIAKIIILIPVFVEIALLTVYAFLLQVINSFYILINHKYWRYCFEITTGALTLIAKTTFFFFGLSDKYPGFDLKTNGDFTLKFTYPQKPKTLYVIPAIGGIIRAVLLIPYLIYTQVISNGAKVGMIGSSVPVFLNGKYPDSTFELARDSLRLSLSQWSYFAGISDVYPSFKINMERNQTIKIFLIIIGALLVFGQWRVNHKSAFEKNELKNKAPYMQQLPNRYAPPYQNYR